MELLCWKWIRMVLEHPQFLVECLPKGGIPLSPFHKTILSLDHSLRNIFWNTQNICKTGILSLGSWVQWGGNCSLKLTGRSSQGIVATTYRALWIFTCKASRHIYAAHYRNWKQHACLINLSQWNILFKLIYLSWHLYEVKYCSILQMRKLGTF